MVADRKSSEARAQRRTAVAAAGLAARSGTRTFSARASHVARIFDSVLIWFSAAKSHRLNASTCFEEPPVCGRLGRVSSVLVGARGKVARNSEALFDAVAHGGKTGLAARIVQNVRYRVILIVASEYFGALDESRKLGLPDLSH